MIRFLVGVFCLFAFCLSTTALDAFERKRSKRAAIKAALAEKIKVSSCYLRKPLSPDNYPTCTNNKASGASPKKSGFADVSVIDENRNEIPDFCIRVDGKVIGSAPRSALALKAGENVIEVFHKDFGHACKQVKISSQEVSRVVFQFMPLREKVTPLTTRLVLRQHHATMVVVNALPGTEVFVDPAKVVQDATNDIERGVPDSRVKKGSGSLKISNLVPDTYIVEFKRPKTEAGIPEQPKCGEGDCKVRIKLDPCHTVRVEARTDGITQSALSTVCEKAKKTKKARKRTWTRKKRATRAHRHRWH